MSQCYVVNVLHSAEALLSFHATWMSFQLRKTEIYEVSSANFQADPPFSLPKQEAFSSDPYPTCTLHNVLRVGEIR